MTAAGILFALAIVAHFTVKHWLAPTGPLLLMGTVLLLLMTLLIVAQNIEEEESAKAAATPPSPDETAQTVVSGISNQQLVAVDGPGPKSSNTAFFGVIAAACLIASMVWLSAGVRASAVSVNISRANHTALAEALTDPNEDVAVKACRGLFEIGLERKRTDLVLALLEQPEVAARCLAGLESHESADVHRSLVARMYTNIMDRAHHAPHLACERAEALAKLPGDPGPQVAVLVNCALAAPSDVVSDCCVQSARRLYDDGAKLAGLLHNSGGDVATLGPEILLGAFQAGALSPEERQRASDMDFPHRSFRTYALHTTCNALKWDVRIHDTSMALARVMGGANCDTRDLKIGDQPGQWTEICRFLDPKLDAQAEASAALCEAVDEFASARAVRVASGRVHAAFKTYHNLKLLQPMQSGTNKAHNELHSAAGFGRRLGEQADYVQGIVAASVGGGGGHVPELEHDIIQRLVGDNPGQATQAIMDQAMAQSTGIDPFAMMESFDRVNSMIDIERQADFKNMSREEQEKLKEMLKQYKEFKGDRSKQKEVDQMREEIERMKKKGAAAQGEADLAKDSVSNQLGR